MSDSVQQQLEKWVVEQAALVQATLTERIIADTPVDTGYTKDHWVTTATINQLGDTGAFENSAPAAVPLEYGHSEQAPVGMVRVNIQRIIQEGAK